MTVWVTNPQETEDYLELFLMVRAVAVNRARAIARAHAFSFRTIKTD